MKNKKIIIISLIAILIIAVLIGIYLYSSSGKVHFLSEEEILTSGGNNPGEVRNISVSTNEELFSEVDTAVNEHLAG